MLNLVSTVAVGETAVIRLRAEIVYSFTTRKFGLLAIGSTESVRQP